MAKKPAPATPVDDVDGTADVVALWRSEILRGQKDVDKWRRDAKAIERRYRAEDAGARKSRYNVLWSNTQTMAPALYHSSPKCIVQRRFLDKDPSGRVACRILERAVQYQIDSGDLHKALKRAVKDRLLGGRGTVWLRYDPTFETVPAPWATSGDGSVSNADQEVPSEASGVVADGEPEPESQAEEQTIDRIKHEIVRVDYVHPDDFVSEPARTWDEVSWIARRAYMTRDELVKRFGPEVGKAVPLTQSPDQQDGAERRARSDLQKAGVWEIWSRADMSVLWIADEYDQPLDQQDDPLQLEDFFPCPEPLTATLTNGSTVPVPDFHQYESQAKAMDTITTRLDRVLNSIRAGGAYDNRFPELADMLEDRMDGKFTPVESWAEFSQGKGFDGAMQFIPIEPFVNALEALYKAREFQKAEIYEITGLSDVLRGQGDPNETATGVKEKGRFATLRLQDQQAEVALFVRDIVRLMGEITCMHFQPDTLAEMASAEEMDELQMQVPAMPPPGMGAPLPPQMQPAMAG